MAAGAYDFLEKPCPPKRLLAAIDRAWEKRALVLKNRQLMAEQTLLEAVDIGAAGASLTAQMDVVEKYLIEAALRSHNGRVTAAADALSLPRKTLYDKINRHGIDPAAHREKN